MLCGWYDYWLNTSIQVSGYINYVFLYRRDILLLLFFSFCYYFFPTINYTVPIFGPFDLKLSGLVLWFIVPRLLFYLFDLVFKTI